MTPNLVMIAISGGHAKAIRNMAGAEDMPLSPFWAQPPIGRRTVSIMRRTMTSRIFLRFSTGQPPIPLIGVASIKETLIRTGVKKIEASVKCGYTNRRVLQCIMK